MLSEDLKLVAEFVGNDGATTSTDRHFLVPVLETSDDDKRRATGLHNIARMLASVPGASFPALNAAEQAAQMQWLEYRLVHVDRSGPGDHHNILEDVNWHLRIRSYVTGSKFTVADLVLALGLQPILQKLSLLERQVYPHLGRWFQLVQQLWNHKTKRNSKQLIIFSKTPL